MIWWDEKLYTDDKVARHPARYRKRVEKKGLRGCFCVVLGRNPANSLEIYASRTLWFPMKRNAVYK